MTPGSYRIPAPSWKTTPQGKTTRQGKKTPPPVKTKEKVGEGDGEASWKLHRGRHASGHSPNLAR